MGQDSECCAVFMVGTKFSIARIAYPCKCTSALADND